MNDPKSPPETDPARDAKRSPVRPSLPQQPQRPPQPSVPQPTPALPESPTNPNAALNTLRGKMELVSDEFAQGKINRAQFNAVYKRYSEQRTIIERLIERNPESEAWKQVIGVKGQTGFLRNHFEAQPLYFVVYRHNHFEPIMVGGKQKPDEEQIKPVLTLVWSMPTRPKNGLGRKPIGDMQWLILACGDHTASAVMFSLEPSIAQARLVRDLHADFERANQAALARGWIVPERMVFPQRALVESGL